MGVSRQKSAPVSGERPKEYAANAEWWNGVGRTVIGGKVRRLDKERIWS